MQPRIPGQPHLAHPASAELLENFVGAKPSSALHGRQGYVLADAAAMGAGKADKSMQDC